LSVVAINSCGTSTASELVISVTVIDTTIYDDMPNINNLQANQSGATYQWFSCDDLQPVLGETNQTFMYYPNPGYYAVEITLNGCVDTSNCLHVFVMSIEENNPLNNVVLFPNPTNELVSINNLTLGTTIEIVDVMGKLVYFTTANNSVLSIATNHLSNGTYFVKLRKDADTKTLPLVVIH